MRGHIEIHVLDSCIRVLKDDEEIFDGQFDECSVDSLVDILGSLGFDDVDVLDVIDNELEDTEDDDWDLNDWEPYYEEDF